MCRKVMFRFSHSHILKFSHYLYLMNQSTITIDVDLDEQKVPQKITWNATDSSTEMKQDAKAMCVAFWDGADKTALRIDLWTKDMMVDEMADFFYQMFSTMADTYQKATQQKDLAEDVRSFSKEFIKKFRDQQLKAKT